MQQQFTGEGPVSVTAELEAPRAAVWAYLEDDARRALWWPAIEIDFNRGGAVAGQRAEHADETLTGTVDVLVPGHALGVVWAAEADPFETSVLVTLHSYEERTKISVNELGFDAFENSIERANESFVAWSSVLSALQAVIAQA